MIAKNFENFDYKDIMKKFYLDTPDAITRKKALNRLKKKYNISIPILRRAIIFVTEDQKTLSHIPEKNFLCARCGKCCIEMNCEFFHAPFCSLNSQKPEVCSNYPLIRVYDKLLMDLNPDCMYIERLIEFEVANLLTLLGYHKI